MFKRLMKKVIKPVSHTTKPLEFLGWRNNMWVMTPDGIGIIFKLGMESEVHLTDAKGITVATAIYPTQALRQAKLKEIPAARMKCSPAQAALLGYF